MVLLCNKSEQPSKVISRKRQKGHSAAHFGPFVLIFGKQEFSTKSNYSAFLSIHAPLPLSKKSEKVTRGSF